MRWEVAFWCGRCVSSCFERSYWVEWSVKLCMRRDSIEARESDVQKSGIKTRPIFSVNL
jgi:hypothetical protein